MGSVPKVGFKVGCSADVARGAHPIVRPGCSNPSLVRGMEKFLRASSKIIEVTWRKVEVAKEEDATKMVVKEGTSKKRVCVWFGETVKISQVSR